MEQDVSLLAGFCAEMLVLSHCCLRIPPPVQELLSARNYYVAILAVNFYRPTTPVGYLTSLKHADFPRSLTSPSKVMGAGEC